ncbi:MAG TPA: hypothetical protein VF832_20455, partial [Longimicrobiales bacterium]
MTLDQALTLRSWGYDVHVVTGLGRLGRLRYLRRPLSPLFMDYRVFERVIDPAVDVVVLPGRYLEQLES